MVKYVIKRLLQAVFILLCVSIILYALVRVMPVNLLRDRYFQTHQQSPAQEEEINQILAMYNLQDLSTMSFGDAFANVITGWWKWLTSFLRGDLGTSFKYNMKVEEKIFQDMGVSFIVSFISLILELIIAIPLGIKCACNQYGKLDYTVTVLTMIGISFPTFFFGSIMIKWFAVDLGWFEPGSLLSNLPVDATPWQVFCDEAWHLVLPIFVLVILSIGSMMRYTRTNTLEVLNADYIRTARAKGLSENKVIYKHVFRNTMIPLVTTLAGVLPGLFGGSMIIEQVFNLPGIGNTAYLAMREGDVPFIMGYNMFIAVLTVLGILLTDIMYAVVDPRVKLGK